MGNFRYVEPLLRETSYNLSVILLVRDPRSMARSRKYLRMVDLWDASKAKKRGPLIKFVWKYMYFDFKLSHMKLK